MKLFARTIFTAAGALLFASAFAAAASADTGNTNSNTQTGSNTASSVQSVASASGDAASDNGTATSGDAAAAAASSQLQRLLLRATNQSATGASADICPECFGQGTDSNITNGNTNAQTGGNTVASEQGIAAVSGIASAVNGGESTTGASVVSAENIQEQIQKIVAHNQRLRIAPPAADDEEEE